MEYPTPQMSDKARGATPRSGGGGGNSACERGNARRLA